MKTLVIYMLETLVCSGVLLSVYTILLDRRIRFIWCRAYLLLVPLFAGLIPLLRIPVWPGPLLEATAPAITIGEWDTTGRIIADPVTTAITPTMICTAVYLLGAVLILSLMGWQVARIRRLRRGAKITRTPSYTLVLTRQKIASFSFFRSVYIWDETPEAEMDVITAHEASHIAHRHSAERIVMECLKAAMWWNPFVWIVARRLTEAEEFEADQDVLSSGYDTKFYMTTLFKQLFGYSPDIANGLRDSLTKKRFQMMTKKTSSRYDLLRLSGTIPVVMGLLCVFSFTTKAAAIRPTASTSDTRVQTEVTQEALSLNNVERSTPTPADVAQSPATKRPAPAAPTPKTEPAPTAKEPALNTDSVVFIRAEVMPMFQGGDLNTYRKWLLTQIKYPVEALKDELSGRVIVSFIIEKDGSISNPKILMSPHELLSNEALRILALTPAGAWTPGMQRGHKIRLSYTLPIDFTVARANENTTMDPSAIQVVGSGEKTK